MTHGSFLGFPGFAVGGLLMAVGVAVFIGSCGVEPEPELPPSVEVPGLGQETDSLLAVLAASQLELAAALRRRDSLVLLLDSLRNRPPPPECPICAECASSPVEEEEDPAACSICEAGGVAWMCMAPGPGYGG